MIKFIRFEKSNQRQNRPKLQMPLPPHHDVTLWLIYTWIPLYPVCYHNCTAFYAYVSSFFECHQRQCAVSYPCQPHRDCCSWSEVIIMPVTGHHTSHATNTAVHTMIPTIIKRRLQMWENVTNFLFFLNSFLRDSSSSNRKTDDHEMKTP